MRIKVVFEIGHVASLKSKTSPEGFTHDWELYVRGADGSNIARFVDRIIFNLHDSFPKPHRGNVATSQNSVFFYSLRGSFAMFSLSFHIPFAVYKDPPYVLKESGYASFNLPIDIILKAGPRDDPKKFTITYDLDITKTLMQKYPLIVDNPSSEFRHKLLDGGGIMINHDGGRCFSPFFFVNALENGYEIHWIISSFRPFE